MISTTNLNWWTPDFRTVGVRQMSYLELLLIFVQAKFAFFPGGYTFLPVVMEVENGSPKWKETNIEGTYFPLSHDYEKKSIYPQTNMFAPKNGGFQ